MADDKEVQLAQMFAMRDDLEGGNPVGPLDESNHTCDILSELEEEKSLEQKQGPVSGDPWSEEPIDAPSRKQRLSSIQFLFPREGIKKNQVKSTKSVNPISTEIEEDDDEEYGATQLLCEEEKESCSCKLIAIDSGQEVYINKPIFLIGCQKSACDMVIPQEAKSHVVSRKHAYILLKNDKAYVKDISSNGTFIGTEGIRESDFYRLPKDTEVELKDRQIVKLANIKLMIVFNK